MNNIGKGPTGAKTFTLRAAGSFVKLRLTYYVPALSSKCFYGYHFLSSIV